MKGGMDISYWFDGSKVEETPYVDGQKHGMEIEYNV